MLAATYNNASAGVWTLIPTNLPTGLVWSSVTSSFTGQYQIASAVNNSIYYSHDYGVNWEVSNSLNNVSWVSLASNSVGDYMYALETSEGQNIHISTTYGKDWITLPVDYSQDDVWTAVATNCNGKVVAVLGHISDGIHLSYNYGTDFGINTIVTPYIAYNDIAISCDGSYMIAVAENTDLEPNSGGIYINQGGGFGNALRAITTTNHWTGCAISADGTLFYAVDSASKGGLFVSSNKGSAWTQLMSIGTVSTLYFSAVSCDSTGMRLIASFSGSVSGKYKAYSYASSNGGITWTDISSRPGSLKVATSLAPSLFMTGSDSSWLGLMAGHAVNSATGAVSATSNIYRYTKCPYGESIDYLYGTINGTYICQQCSVGTYTSSYDVESESAICTKCPVDTYGTMGENGENECISCPYPTSTAGEGSTECTVFWLNLSLALQFSLYGLGLLWFIYVMVSGNKNTIAAFVVLVFPLLDVFTDFAYIATSKFYDTMIFVLCVVMFLHPTPLFVYKLVKYDTLVPTAARNLYWIGYGTTATRLDSVNDSGDIVGDVIPYPTIFGKRFVLLFDFQTHSNLGFLFWEALTWIVAVFAQILTILLGPVFFFVWLVIGIFLQASKTISITSVWNHWFYIWRGDHDLDDIGGGTVDTEELNYGLLLQFCCETIPHIALQSTNNTLLHAWETDAIAIISFFFSILMALNALYHYFYHSSMVAQTRSMKDVPIDRSIRFGILGTSCILFDGKLEAYSKIIRGFDTSHPDSQLLRNPAANDRLIGYKNDGADLMVGDRETVIATSIDNYSPPSLDAPLVPAYVSAPQQTQQAPKPASAPQLAQPAPKVAGPQQAMLAPKATSAPQQAQVARVSSNPPTRGNSNSIAASTTTATASLVPPKAPPPQLLCPLSHVLMTDPVIAEDGYTYDRVAIMQYISQYHCSPINHAPISDAVMTNRTVANMILKYNSTGSI